MGSLCQEVGGASLHLIVVFFKLTPVQHLTARSRRSHSGPQWFPVSQWNQTLVNGRCDSSALGVGRPAVCVVTDLVTALTQIVAQHVQPNVPPWSLTPRRAPGVLNRCSHIRTTVHFRMPEKSVPINGMSNAIFLNIPGCPSAFKYMLQYTSQHTGYSDPPSPLSLSLCICI